MGAKFIIGNMNFRTIKCHQSYKKELGHIGTLKASLSLTEIISDNPERNTLSFF